MHGMLSAQSLLIRTPLNPEQRELAAIIEESGGVLLQVINDILDYSKLASGCFSLSSEHICVSEIINSVIRSFQATLRPAVKLEISIDKTIPQTAKGDPLRYRQIIQNLVANAMKFTYSGTITLWVTVLEEDEDFYTVLTEVKDTGIGVEAKDIKSLFNPFTQLDNSMTKQHQGTGLGLSICKSLTHLMGGEIAFRANPQQCGSIFWFTVKLSKLNLPTNLTNLTERTISSKATKEDYAQIQEVAPKKTLLLAEDNFINQKVMLKMLKSFGFEKVHTAVNGKDAADLAKEHAEVYDLILMDINMPVLDGVGATTQIRVSGNKVPIVAMTANALKGDAETYLASGMNDYIPKPISQQHLLVTLLKWLKI
jgi:osomolarity two-component system sensor histidine kinase TcsA